jgi:hypothetical protein
LKECHFKTYVSIAIDLFIYNFIKLTLMNKIVFVALSLVLASAFVVGNFATGQAEAVGQGCPKSGNSNSPPNPQSPQPVSTEASTSYKI